MTPAVSGAGPAWMRHRWAEPLLVAAVLAVALLLAHGSALDAGWRWDDGGLLGRCLNMGRVHESLRTVKQVRPCR